MRNACSIGPNRAQGSMVKGMRTMISKKPCTLFKQTQTIRSKTQDIARICKLIHHQEVSTSPPGNHPNDNQGFGDSVKLSSSMCAIEKVSLNVNGGSSTSNMDVT